MNPKIHPAYMPGLCKDMGQPVRIGCPIYLGVVPRSMVYSKTGIDSLKT